jgi:hypothetical protein
VLLLGGVFTPGPRRTIQILPWLFEFEKELVFKRINLATRALKRGWGKVLLLK